MNERDDLSMLHALALQNTAQLDYDEKAEQMKHYREHRQKCLKAYGFEKTFDAEWYGVPPVTAASTPTDHTTARDRLPS